MAHEIDTVGLDVIEGLEAVLKASARETLPFGLTGESLGCVDCRPAVTNSNDGLLGRSEEIFRESTPVFEVIGR